MPRDPYIISIKIFYEAFYPSTLAISNVTAEILHFPLNLFLLAAGLVKYCLSMGLAMA